MHSSTAISYIFSKIVTFFYLGLQLVILTLQVFSMTLQFLHLSCLFLLFFLNLLMPMEELIFWRLVHRMASHCDWCIKCVVKATYATERLGNVRFPHASPSDAFNVHVNSPNPFNFLHPRFKSTVFFPRLKKHKIPIGEKGGIVSTMIFRPTVTPLTPA